MHDYDFYLYFLLIFHISVHHIQCFLPFVHSIHVNIHSSKHHTWCSIDQLFAETVNRKMAFHLLFNLNDVCYWLLLVISIANIEHGFDCFIVLVPLSLHHVHMYNVYRYNINIIDYTLSIFYRSISTKFWKWFNWPINLDA